MRVELHTQCVEAGLRKTALHSLQPQFTDAIAFVVSERLLRTEYDPIDNPAPEKAEWVQKRTWMRQHTPRAQAEKGTHRDDHIEVKDGKWHTREQMRENTHP